MGSFLFCPKSRTAKLDQQEQAIMDCKITRDKIKTYIKRLEKNEKLRKDKAKEALKNKDRDKARLYLQQSKLYKEQASSASGQLNMIEEQIIQIETARQQKETIKVLEQGNKVLKQLTDEVNIEKWEKIADDMNEVKNQQEEIGNFLKSHNIDQDEYEAAVDKELEALMKLEGFNADVELPNAGNKEVNNVDKIKEKENEKEKEELHAIEI